MLKPHSKFQFSMLKSLKVSNTFTSQFSQVLVQCFSSLVKAVTSQAENYKHLRIDTGAWDVIDVVVCISCSTPHRLISDTSYERSIFLLLNCIKHVNIN